MRLSIIARAHLAAPHRVSLTRPISSSSSKPQIPLFLRPPVHPIALTDLRKWHNWAKTLTSSVGSSFLDADNGPDTTLLHRELKWLIQDAAEDKSLSSLLGIDADRRPKPGLKNVGLRVGIEELYVLWKQRIHERRPFQYIVGCEHWRDLVLSVEEGVLIPRPETEGLVDLVAEVVSDNEVLRDGLWVDLGTGSGAIAIAVCRVLEGRGRVIATDLSSTALAVAGYNVQRYGLQELIELRQGSWYEPLKDVQGKLSGIISNPPYIPSDNIVGLQAEVGKHEPRISLDGGTNGMDDLIHLCDEAAVMLRPGGFFAFEVTMILYEVLRLYPPVIGQYQHTYAYTKEGEVSIPSGVDVALPTLLIHHDPEYWGEDANQFKLERFSAGVSKASKDCILSLRLGT